MRALEVSLLDAEPPRLRAIARFWDVERGTGRPQELIAMLRQAMTDPAAVQRAWEALSADERQALQMLMAANGELPRRAFTRRWGEIRAMGSGRMEREQPWLAPVSPAEGLWYKGFIFAAFEQRPSGFYEVIFVPQEIGQHLPILPAASSPLALEPTEEPAVVVSWGDTLLDDACTLLAYVQSQPLRIGTNDEWPAAHFSRLVRQLRSDARERFEFLWHLIGRMGWLRVSETGVLRPEPGITISWLQSSSERQRLILAEAWRHSPTWNDLFHVESLRPEDTGAWRNDPVLARRAILRHLSSCTPGMWYRVADLIAAIKQTDPDFQRPDGDYSAWYIRDAATGEYLSGFESWDAVEGALIRYVLRCPLAWLGVVDLGADRVEAVPTSFRLTAGGAAFVGSAELPAEGEVRPLQLHLDFTISVPAAARYERFQLARVAEWVRSGDPFVYRLTPASLERARQQGITVGRVLEFLNRATRAPVPRAIEAALTRWEVRGSEARIERAVLLRLESEELMDRVIASPFTRGLILERLNATTAVVRPRDWSELVVGLGRLGLLPQVVDAERGQGNPSS